MSSPSSDADPRSSTAEAASNTLGQIADTTSNAAANAAQTATNAASSAGDALANATAKALGDSSYNAHKEDPQAEQSHDDVAKSHPADVPERIAEHPNMSAVPKVADGDEERPSEPELQDLGWSEDPHIPNPVIHGMTNEDFWILARRFNKQTYHVKALPDLPPGDLDMNIADKDEFFPDKLRSTLERVYTTVGISMVALLTHIARLRSWKEWRRTTLFAAIYLVAWIFNYLVPAFSALLLLLFVSPRARRILFPPAPLAAISKKGTAQVPKSGHLGSADSATGAAESYKGEAVEQEASNLVSSISSVAVSTAVGKGTPSSAEPHPDDQDEDEDGKNEAKQVEESIPDPTKLPKVGAQAKTKASGDKSLEKGDHAAAAVDHGVWSQLQPILHGLEDLCDTWERFGNALAPTPPFQQYRPRLFIASALILPLFLISLYVTSAMVYKGSGFGIGFGFFGQPLFDMAKLSDAKKWLDKNFPNWPEMLQLRNSLLKGVPTNAQLTVTLLRIGEAAKSPLPPPPPAIAAPDPTAAQGKDMVKDLPPEYQSEMHDAVHEDQNSSGPTAQEAMQQHAAENSEIGTPTDKNSSSKKKHGFLFRLFKGGVHAGTSTAMGANAAKATVGSTHSKNRLGVVKKNLQTEARGDGPASFRGRYRGKRGYIDILTTSATPSICFEPEWGAHTKAAQAAVDALPENADASVKNPLEKALEKTRPKALFSFQIDEIAELRKIGGLGWKGKIVVGWAMSSEIADGLEIVTKTGEKLKMTAMPRRDEVFNRILALGKQHWEMW
ncbi:unnamed protein product [Sympodiomycopsis kandeliae]